MAQEGYWYCEACGFSNEPRDTLFCRGCGRRKEDATDKERWAKFTIDAMIAAAWPENDADDARAD